MCKGAKSRLPGSPRLLREFTRTHSFNRQSSQTAYSGDRIQTILQLLALGEHQSMLLASHISYRHWRPKDIKGRKATWCTHCHGLYLPEEQFLDVPIDLQVSLPQRWTAKLFWLHCIGIAVMTSWRLESNACLDPSTPALSSRYRCEEFRECVTCLQSEPLTLQNLIEV